MTGKVRCIRSSRYAFYEPHSTIVTACPRARRRAVAGIFLLADIRIASGVSELGMNENKQTSVIVGGAGPVGLGLACDLGQRGVDCILIEKRDGAINVPKQSMVSARNMEFCRRWGVAKTVRTAVWPESFP